MTDEPLARASQPLTTVAGYSGWRQWIGALGGWRRRLVLIAAGALSMLAFAPFFVWPVLWLTLAVLYLALPHIDASPCTARGPSRATVLRAAGAGWWFGFGYHFAGLYWIGEAFLVEADIFGWLLPVAVTIMPAGLALFTAATAAATVALAPTRGVSRALAFAIAFGLSEWLRGHVLTGFPWNVLGYALTYPVVLMQSAGVIGIYGLTIVAVLVFILPLELWEPKGSDGRGAAPRRHFAALGAAFAPLAVMLAYGSYQLRTAPPAIADAHRIRIVQPSVPQKEKWRPENQRRIFDEHLALSLTAPDGTIDGAAGVSLIVWPEAAMPFLPLDQPIVASDIGRMLPAGSALIAGALRADPATETAPRRIYNSLITYSSGGSGEPARALQTYDKTHLVPFGEFLPLQGVLEAIGLQQLSRLRGGFAAGPEPRPPLIVPGVGLFAPLICYEALFPARVVQSVERPRAMLNVTNDGWFGNSTGPRQHFHMSRVRAVEEGLPLVRAANNGISAVIDMHGKIVARLDMNVRGTIDVLLPAANTKPVYARIGDLAFILMAAFLALKFALARKIFA